MANSHDAFNAAASDPTAPSPQTPADSRDSRDSAPGPLARLWTFLLVSVVFGGAFLVLFAFLLPDLDRHALPIGQAESASRRLGHALTWIAFSVRTFDLMGGVILVLLSVLVLARRRWFASAAGLIAAGVMLFPLVPRLLNVPAPSPYESDAPRLTVASLNTLGDSARSAEFRAFIDATNPDVIVLIEYEVGIDAREREWLRQRWPYFAAMPSDDRFGMAMFSRLPYVERPSMVPRLQLQTDSGDFVRYPMVDPQIRAVVKVADQEVVIQGAHPVPPTGLSLLAEQRAVHRAFANWAASEPRPRILIGDLNATPRAQSSAWFAKAGLVESRDPNEVIDARTWPSGLGVPLIMGVRIDRALASRELTCEKFVVGPHNGSDHRPIAVRYVLTPGN